jgi:very-short-patch-repair endonuclease
MTMTPIISYHPRLKDRAHELRQNMTWAEVKLWLHLKRKQVLGFDFDRQRPIGEFIVDFYCKRLRLAIEVDGRSHDYKEEADVRRDRILADLGVRVLRVWNAEIRGDLSGVLSRIHAVVQERAMELGVSFDKGNPPRPAATPPVEGNDPPRPAATPPAEGNDLACGHPPRPAATPPVEGIFTT